MLKFLIYIDTCNSLPIAVVDLDQTDLKFDDVGNRITVIYRRCTENITEVYEWRQASKPWLRKTAVTKECFCYRPA